MAQGRHYVRDALGSEQLYDLKSDPFGRMNLIDSVEAKKVAGVFRRKLLDELTDNPGSTEVEKANLRFYKQSLKLVVEASPVPREPISALEERSSRRREESEYLSSNPMGFRLCQPWFSASFSQCFTASRDRFGCTTPTAPLSLRRPITRRNA